MRPLSFEDAQALVVRDEALDAAVAKVATLDLSGICERLVLDQGWTMETCDEVEDLYRKFLVLNLRYPDRKLCPNGPVDTFWHAHILDTQQYADDCLALFGGPLHHFPYFGLRGDEVELECAFSDTVDLFVRHFGVDPTAGENARSCRPQRCP